MNEERKYDFLKELSPRDEKEFIKIMRKHPALDKSAQKRIIKKCEEKLAMKNNNNVSEAEVINAPVEVIKKTAWYRSPVMTIAASLLLIAGIGTATIAGLSRGNGEKTPDDIPPVFSTDATEATTLVPVTGTEKPDVTGTMTVPAEDVTAAAEGTSGGYTVKTTPVTEKAPAVTTESEKDELIINGYNLYDYPNFVNYINANHLTETFANEPDNCQISILDVTGDSQPDLLIYRWGHLGMIVPHDDEYSIVPSNYECSTQLCEGNIIYFEQGNPPYCDGTFFRYLGNGQYELLDSIRCSLYDYDADTTSVIDVENIKECYHFTYDENNRYSDSLNGFSRYSGADYEENMAQDQITNEEAAAVLSKYTKRAMPDTVSVTLVK